MNIKVFVLTALALNVIAYLLLSFVQLSIDPSTWSEALRGHFAFVSGLSLLIAIIPSIKG